MSSVNTSLSEDACPNQDNSGTHGGLLVIADPACGITEFDSFTLQGCGYQAFLWQATDNTILVIGLYLKTRETLQSDTNATIIAKILSLLEQTTHPYVVIGDWPLSTTGPRTKRLHFSTPLTAREEEEDPAQAMTRSQNAGDKHLGRPAVPPKPEPPQGSKAGTPENPKEEILTDDDMALEGTYDVDYF